MRRSTRRSSMAVSLDSALDSDSVRRISTRRSSILPSADTRNAGNFTTKFSMSSFVKRAEELTDDQRTAIERVGFGNLLKIHHHTLRKNLLVEWMERWDCKKRAFLLLSRELTITAMDVGLILGLRITGKPVALDEDEPFSDLEQQYGATKRSRKINVSAIEQKLDDLGDSADEDFVRSFLLFTFGTLLFPNSSSKIDSRYLSFLEDLDKVPQYAWGVAVIEDLFCCLSRRIEEQAKSIDGCLLLLQIWSYEHIDIGQPNILSTSSSFPRACCWDSSRCTSQRHWFATKFDEVEENQVTWKLEPRSTELDVDVIREFLETQTDMKGVTTLEHSSPSPPAVGVMVTNATSRRTSTKCPRLPPKSSRRMAMLHEEEPTEYKGIDDQVQDDVSEKSRLSMDMSEVTVEFPECTSSLDVQKIQDDQAATKEGDRILKSENSRLKKEVAELRSEITLLRSQLSVIPKLEDEIARLKKDAAEMKELQCLRSRLERIALGYFHEDAAQ